MTWILTNLLHFWTNSQFFVNANFFNFAKPITVQLFQKRVPFKKTLHTKNKSQQINHYDKNIKISTLQKSSKATFLLQKIVEYVTLQYCMWDVFVLLSLQRIFNFLHHNGNFCNFNAHDVKITAKTRVSLIFFFLLFFNFMLIQIYPWLTFQWKNAQRKELFWSKIQPVLILS